MNNTNNGDTKELNSYLNARNVAVLMYITKCNPIEIGDFLKAQYEFWFEENREHSILVKSALEKATFNKINKVFWKIIRDEYPALEEVHMMKESFKIMENDTEFQKKYPKVFENAKDRINQINSLIKDDTKELNTYLKARNVAVLMNFTKLTPMEICNFLEAQYVVGFEEDRDNLVFEESNLKKTIFNKLNKNWWKILSEEHPAFEVFHMILEALKIMKNDEEFQKNYPKVYEDAQNCMEQIKNMTMVQKDSENK